MTPSPTATTDVLDSLIPEIRKARSEFGSIPEGRRRDLAKIARFVRGKLDGGETARLIFICTHNSRRSHFGQIWAQTAATYYGIAGIETFSGGTEATACNPRTVGALRRAGFAIDEPAPGDNPIYSVRHAKTGEPIAAFSKVYSGDGNPAEDFLAVMTCTHADENCPVVHGSAMRVAIPFEDPKASDGSDTEEATYDERCRQIAREMFFLMDQVRATDGMTASGRMASPSD
jgi:protein-tyrosine-phosphatase